MSLAPIPKLAEKLCFAPCPENTPCECRDRWRMNNMDVNSSYWQIYESQAGKTEDQKQEQVYPLGR